MYHDYRVPLCVLQGEPVINRRGSRTHPWRIGGFLKGPSAAWYHCPHCDFHDRVFHPVCPECGRPFMRDYIDWRMHPRDPDLTGTFFHDPFRAWFWLLALTAALLISLRLPF
jgi:hypothetical protein